jgi:hypothetical protein
MLFYDSRFNIILGASLLVAIICYYPKRKLFKLYCIKMYYGELKDG